MADLEVVAAATATLTLEQRIERLEWLLARHGLKEDEAAPYVVQKGIVDGSGSEKYGTGDFAGEGDPYGIRSEYTEQSAAKSKTWIRTNTTDEPNTFTLMKRGTALDEASTEMGTFPTLEDAEKAQAITEQN